jgi:hypothetical protein
MISGLQPDRSSDYTSAAKLHLLPLMFIHSVNVKDCAAGVDASSSAAHNRRVLFLSDSTARSKP